MALLAKPARARATFHRLRVWRVERLTDASVAVTFVVPPELWDEYGYRAGQHLTLRATIAGEEVRQSYSISQRPVSPGGVAEGGTLRIASAEVPGGRMSTWLNRVLQAGDEVDVLPPLGTFVVEPQPDQARHHVAIAAGSGITPVLAVLQTALTDEPLSRATLLYGNRRTDTVMFLEELEDLKNAHPGRFQLVHVLSREPQDVELFSGRLDRDRLTRILDTLVPTDENTQWWLCGPLGLVTTAQEVLAGRGAAKDHVHHEIFHADDAPTRPAPTPAEPVDDSAPPAAVVTVTLDGRTTDVLMRSRDETVLAATLRARPDAPYSCTGGVCGTCRARLVEGEVTMDRHYALEDDEVAAGIVLTCQAHPVTDRVRLDYDA